VVAIAEFGKAATSTNSIICIISVAAPVGYESSARQKMQVRHACHKHQHIHGSHAAASTCMTNLLLLL
jgi:hypothetical protein